MRRLFAICAALAALSSACGSDSATPLDTVRAAASETAGADTARMYMEMETGRPEIPKVNFNGVFDFERQRLSFEMDGKTLGIPGLEGKIQAIMDVAGSPVQYMRLPGLEDELDGKHWMKVDLGAAIAEVCPDVDFEALLSAQSGDPTSGLQILEGAERVDSIGEEKVRDAATTHYHVVLDVRKAAERAPEEAREALRQAAAMQTDPEQEMDVWIDGDGRVRKYEQTIDMSTVNLPDCLNTPEAQAANPFQGTSKILYELYDFGAAANVELPAKNDIVDVQDLIEDAA
jgi:hypothetical protein